MVWGGCTNQDRDALGKLQNEAARLMTRLIRSASRAYLYRKCKWAKLDKRRTFQRLCFINRCVKGLVSEDIYQLIPPLLIIILEMLQIYPIFVLELKYFASLVCLLSSPYGMN